MRAISSHHQRGFMAGRTKQFGVFSPITPGVDVSGGESKVQCCKEQYCIGTWNVRYMNQGNLEVVK